MNATTWNICNSIGQTYRINEWYESQDQKILKQEMSQKS
jgi:hypothetical protein